MWRDNFLDPLIARWRHRWVTDRQYRAAMSGLIALVALLGTCSCMGIVSAFANGALSGSGLSGGVGPPGGPRGGSGVLAGVPQFPTATMPGWSVPVTPISEPVPVSQTPQPSPTNAPTATPPPTITACSPTCGAVVGHSESPSPNWHHCVTACDSITLTTDQPNTAVTVSISFSGAGISPVSGQVTTDGAGKATFAFALVGLPGTGKGHVQLQAPGGIVAFRYPYD